ncbi:MAG TPA: hypothetical protein VFK01_17830 [Bradyrhizobium sp.]|nr:hypothetical protein [Bradyrhizobium sp.]
MTKAAPSPFARWSSSLPRSPPALALGYLFVNKIADISREEDCMLAQRRNCGGVELPAGR